VADRTEADTPVFGIVVLLDALGTKGIVAHQSPSELIRKWNDFLDQLTLFVEDVQVRLKSSTSSLLSFSDSIYITIPTDDLWEAVLALGRLQIPFFEALRAGIFLRGVVSCGYFYQSQTKVFGPAIDEAAAWYEQADWFGVAATPTLGRRLDVLHEDHADLTSHFVLHRLPLKERSGPPHWCLNWPAYARRTYPDVARIRLLEAFADFGGVVAPGVLPKYQNTIEFFDGKP
jgi:hypothetical protein